VGRGFVWSGNAKLTRDVAGEELLERIARENEIVMQRRREIEQKKKLEQEVKLKGKDAFKTRRLGSDPLDPNFFPPLPPPSSSSSSSSFPGSGSGSGGARRFDAFRRNGRRRG